MNNSTGGDGSGITDTDGGNLTYAHAGYESAAFEWTDAKAGSAKVEYKLSSAATAVPPAKVLPEAATGRLKELR